MLQCRIVSTYLLVLAALLQSGLAPLPASAKAYFATRKEMVNKAEIIALVDIGAVETCQEKGQYFTFLEKSTSKVEKTYKGKLPQQITLFGAETFKCGQMRIIPGKAIVFLSKDAPLYHGCNWHLSLNHIDGKNINWLVKDDDRRQQQTTLAEAEKQLKEDLKPAESSALSRIAQAKYFCSGAMGEGGEIPEEYKAYQEILKSPEQNKSRLIEIANTGTPAGKIYAISILSKIDNKLAKSLLSGLFGNREKLRFYSGCERSEDTLADIAKALSSKGSYLDFKLYGH